MGSIIEPFNSIRYPPGLEVGDSIASPGLSSNPTTQMEHEDRQIGYGLPKVFNHEELKEATNNFDSSQVLGSGGYGIVYLGKLQGKMVAVKKLLKNNSRLVEQFINEVGLLSRIRHLNLVTLQGSTDTSSQELLLVYDFIPNGTVAEHLYGGKRPTLTWDTRIRIAAETAEALAYLHALEPPVIHRDVKTPNILLDNDLHAKVADFGLCRLFPLDVTHVSTLPQGTMGYRDPEYDCSMRLTKKSDVYSFGVVLLELMSGKKAVDTNRVTDNIDDNRAIENVYLNAMALRKIKGNKLKELVDPKLNYLSDYDSRRMINSVAELALECLRPEGKFRPTMVQVVKVLTDIKDMKYKINDKDVSSPQAYVFTHTELTQATESFHKSRHLSKKIYIGKLQGKMVAVKKLLKNNSRLVEQFVNEVGLLSRIRHLNLVTLHGSTDTSSQELLLVYDFIPNGTVAEHLYGGNRPTLTWDTRIRIAAETAEALAYLHALDPPVIHRDVKTPNILLDNDLHAKVADFGLCRLFPLDVTHVSTLPQGTMGYRDPEYDCSMRLTKKSDVYSFGVVLLELMSGMKAVDTNRVTDNIDDNRAIENVYLNAMALRKIKGNKLKELVDPKLNYLSDYDSRRMINSVAELALECLRPEGKSRPTMVQVVKVLTDIKDMKYKINDKDVSGPQAYVFTHTELTQATESFHESRHLSKKIYIGNFDGLAVAVKVRQVKKLSKREEMFNEVKVLSQLRHHNLATLYGSTDPGRKEMLLVYEYVPNCSVGHHLHGPHEALLLQKEKQIPLDWDLRIRIAIETAEALCYLHYHEPPVIHHEISTYNMLLDENDHVKLRGLNLDRDSIDRVGYADGTWSEIFFTSTTNYDVYCFGVVLLELISRNKAFLFKYGWHVGGMSLGKWSQKMIQKNELDEFVDKKLDYHSNLDTKKMVTSVAELACRCVQTKRRTRPTMSEVLLGLKQIEDGSKKTETTPISNC